MQFCLALKKIGQNDLASFMKLPVPAQHGIRAIRHLMQLCSRRPLIVSQPQLHILAVRLLDHQAAPVGEARPAAVAAEVVEAAGKTAAFSLVSVEKSCEC